VSDTFSNLILAPPNEAFGYATHDADKDKSNVALGLKTPDSSSGEYSNLSDSQDITVIRSDKQAIILFMAFLSLML
jgi:hypothetical protein